RFGSHSQDQVLVFPEFALGTVAADAVKSLAPEHDRTMRKGREKGLSGNSPDFGQAQRAPAGIDDLAQGADQTDIRMAPEKFQLATDPIRTRNIVGVHARNQWCRGPLDADIGASDRA